MNFACEKLKAAPVNGRAPAKPWPSMQAALSSENHLAASNSSESWDVLCLFHGVLLEPIVLAEGEVPR